MYELLIVDDEEISRASLATYYPWEKTGFHVCGQAADGKAALDFIQNHSVQVVLTDISMPVMNGIDLARELSQRPSSPIVVFLTAYSDFAYAQSAIRYGVRFYILKPSSFDEIAETFSQIRQELDRVYNVVLESPREETDSVVEQTYAYIKGNYRTASLMDLSKKLYMHASYLSQIIKLKTGKTFSDLLHEERMKQAGILLSSPDAKVYNVSFDVGYTNPNNFTRSFRSYYGQTPKEYQHTHAQPRHPS